MLKDTKAFGVDFFLVKSISGIRAMALGKGNWHCDLANLSFDTEDILNKNVHNRTQRRSVNPSEDG